MLITILCKNVLFTFYQIIVDAQQVTQPVQPVPEKKSSSSSLYFWGCIVVVALMLLSFVGGLFVGGKYLGSDGNGSDTTESTTSETTIDPNNNNGDEKILTVTKPSENESVNGKLLVEGQASGSLKELIIKVYDDDWNHIGIAYAGLNTTASVDDWSTYVHITSSPSSLNGVVRIFPADEGEESRKLVTIPISFEEQGTPGRVRLFTPLYLQTITGETVYFKGQMRDFYDATVGIRLKDDAEKELMKDTIKASGNNTGQWAQFAKVVKIKGLPKDGGNGVWEICEIDEEGVFGEVILTIPILFQ